MFDLTKKLLIGLLISIVNVFNHTRCVLLSNQKCITQPTYINLNSNENSHYYPLEVELDRCVESCHTLNDLSNKVCVPNKTQDLNLSVSNMIAGIIESKILTRHISWECKCKLDGRKCNSNQWLNNDKCGCECKKRHVCKKYYIWNPATCSC